MVHGLTLTLPISDDACRRPHRTRQPCRAAASANANGSTGNSKPRTSSLMMPDADAPPQAMTLDDYLGPRQGGADAAPRLMSPLPQTRGQDGTPLSERPYLVFLPGIDGTGMNALGQFGLLAPQFELVALNIPNTDRTPFAYDTHTPRLPHHPRNVHLGAFL